MLNLFLATVFHFHLFDHARLPVSPNFLALLSHPFNMFSARISATTDWEYLPQPSD